MLGPLSVTSDSLVSSFTHIGDRHPSSLAHRPSMGPEALRRRPDRYPHLAYRLRDRARMRPLGRTMSSMPHAADAFNFSDRTDVTVTPAEQAIGWRGR